MRIALDVMGGDDAPQPNIDGAIAALEADSDLEIAMVGDQPLIDSLIEKSGYSGDRMQVVPAEGVVGMAEKPTIAHRKKPNNSIAVCWRLMAQKEVDGVVSAGNTGAVVAAALWSKLFLKGIKRPGIAVTLPTLRGRSILMDVGANPAARPEHLYQYGVIGSVYSRRILGVSGPSIGLMNIGSEEGKGNDLYRETHTFLSNSPLKDIYVGNVEGRGLYRGEADVLICEGFVGNIVLKVSEGMVDYLFKSVGSALMEQLDTERHIAQRVFQEVAARHQYSEAGGAPLLGIDGICIICHGSSDARSIKNALGVAKSLNDHQLNKHIVEEMQKYSL
ncbi:Phosphate acyltransferase [Polystyrenella longa]|uniref:Phosphate acyltransferase n=1 Tax=Polystyrenella longa TaxID=2528007 RepID=A0A518CLV3_9PLAN|nr:phosphate acyltransferase PlsX [Polystyrenella longa]QDU80164.1 Phosphate acyltransferase [Polystyrenella longa]